MSRQGLLTLALALALGCTTTHVHIFGGYHYDPTRDCLESAAAIDVIDGPDPGSCPGLRCWASAGGDVYVTDTACDAPADFTEHTSDTGSACVKALADYAHDLCPAPPDGGGM